MTIPPSLGGDEKNHLQKFLFLQKCRMTTILSTNLRLTLKSGGLSAVGCISGLPFMMFSIRILSSSTFLSASCNNNVPTYTTISYITVISRGCRSADSLPESVRASASLQVFCSRLKTELFARSYSSSD